MRHSHSAPPAPPPRRRLAPVLPWIALAVLLGGCRADVLHQVDEASATRIVSVLQENGIEASKVVHDEEANQWRISVRRDDAARAYSLLHEYKLTEGSERRMQHVFGQSKLVLTPTEEKALYLEALQGEIAHTLESIHGVIDARVHLVQPQRDLAGRLTVQSKASVVLEYQPSGHGLPPILDDEVRRLVANAAADLAAERVEVVQKPAAIAAAAGPQDDLRLVGVGPLLLEASSLGTLETFVAGISAAFGLLGFLLFYQTRLVARLRRELVAARTHLVPAGEPEAG